MLIALGLLVANIVSAEEISACVSDETRIARIVPQGQTCLEGETSTAWNQSGPKGDEGIAGPRGASGPKGGTGPAGINARCCADAPNWWANSVLDGLFIIAAALIAAISTLVVGIRTFYRQKEYEAVRQRYLVEGVDVLAASSEDVVGIAKNNWAKCLGALKLFKAGADLEGRELREGQLPLSQNQFLSTAQYRVLVITGSPVISMIHQLTLSYGLKVCWEVDDILKGLEMYLAMGEGKPSRKEAAEVAEKKLLEMRDGWEPYDFYINELLALGGLLEKQRFSFNVIDTIQDHEIVRNVVQHLEEKFKDKLPQQDDAGGNGDA